MKLLETVFFSNFKYYLRYYDEDMNKSYITSDIEQECDTFIKSDKGNFKGFKYKESFELQKLKQSESRQYFNINPTQKAILKFNNFNKSPRCFYLDIETRVGQNSTGFPVPDKALEEVSLIQFYDNVTDKAYLIGRNPFYYKEHYLSLVDETVEYFQVSSEAEIFEVFFKLLSTMKPLLIYAWNGEGFDFPYLFNRCNKLGLDVGRFSPFYSELTNLKGKSKTDLAVLKENKDLVTKNSTYSLDVVGCHYLDMMLVYKKFVFKPQSSYSLQNIAEVELGQSKVEHLEFETFDDFYLGNYKLPANPTESQKKTLCYKFTLEGKPYSEVRKAGHGQFLYYGILDVVILKNLDKAKKFTNLVMTLAETMRVVPSRVFGTIYPWKSLLDTELYKQGFVSDMNLDENGEVKESQKAEKPLVGGFVRDPIKGKHAWILSEDVNSMYPMLAMAGSNISPEKLVENVPDDLNNFLVEHLKKGTDEEQNESNLLELSSELKDKLKTLLRKYNYSLAPNCAVFEKDDIGIIPRLVNKFYNDRKVYKKEMLKYEQLEIKVEEELKRRNLI